MLILFSINLIKIKIISFFKNKISILFGIEGVAIKKKQKVYFITLFLSHRQKKHPKCLMSTTRLSSTLTRQSEF
jgi:hypothetical protein